MIEQLSSFKSGTGEASLGEICLPQRSHFAFFLRKIALTGCETIDLSMGTWSVPGL